MPHVEHVRFFLTDYGVIPDSVVLGAAISDSNSHFKKEWHERRKVIGSRLYLQTEIEAREKEVTETLSLSQIMNYFKESWAQLPDYRKPSNNRKYEISVRIPVKTITCSG